MRPFQDLFSTNVSIWHFFYSLLCAVWGLLVWSVCGGALTRSAALYLTREEKISPRAALSFGMRRWTSYAGGPALPILCCLLMVIPLAILGLIARANLGAAFVAMIWPVVLVFGVLLAILLVGLAFGWVLMWPTISVEGTEPFDAMSRSYSYTYHRPARYLFYAIVALLIGMVAVFFVDLIAEAAISLSNWGVSWGTGTKQIVALNLPKAANDSDTLNFARQAILFWSNLIRLVVFGYVASYFWTAATAIYLLLRRDEDGAEMDEIFLDANSTQFGLPPLKTDAAGVPSMGEQDSAK